MPEKIIEIPGVGNIAFPDTMSDDEIGVAAKKIFDEKQGAFGFTTTGAGQSVTASAAPDESLAKHAWRVANTPLVPVLATAAHAIANEIDEPALDRSQTEAQLRGFLSGATGAAGDLLANMTSPLGIALTLANLGPESKAVPAALQPLLRLPAVKSAQNFVARTGGALFTGAGLQQAFTAPSPEEALQGLGQAAGGTLGMARMTPLNPNERFLQSDALRRSAEEQVSKRVLAPANPRYRAQAQQVAPEILKRGWTGDRIRLQQFADELIGNASERIDQVSDAEAPGQTISTRPILADIDRALEETTQPRAPVTRTERSPLLDASGQPIERDVTTTPSPQVNPLLETYHAELVRLRDFIKASGARMSLADLKRVRGQFDDVAAQAGAYAERTGSVELGAKAGAAETSANAVRRQIAAERPNLVDANADMHLGIAVRNILDPAKGRPSTGSVTTGATGGLHTTMSIVGSHITNIPGLKALAAFLASDLIPRLKNAQVSPANQLRLAHQKMALAKALQAGKYNEAYGIARGLAAMTPALTKHEQE